MTDEHSSRSNHSRSWLERLSNVLLREPQDREQLFELLRDAEQRNILDSDALRMIEGVLQVSEMQARDIMIPRSQMVVIAEDEPLETIIPTIVESAHSRFPVIGNDKDQVSGILLAKDLISYFYEKRDQALDLKPLLRTPVFVPESKRLAVLLEEFRIQHNHMAIVVDEYGGVAGLVTIEDILEEIVGDIEDEHDVEEADNIAQISATSYRVNPLTPIEDFNHYFKCNLSDEEVDTIGGLVMHSLGHMPKKDEIITIDNYCFKVLDSDNRRVGLLEASMLENESSN